MSTGDFRDDQWIPGASKVGLLLDEPWDSKSSGWFLIGGEKTLSQRQQWGSVQDPTQENQKDIDFLLFAAIKTEGKIVEEKEVVSIVSSQRGMLPSQKSKGVVGGLDLIFS